ncbi:MAG: hypothetical protein VX278_05545, partial [Myxococcota bacterium]|nr:hypothetical protein [Myxococcota bacterium]
QIICSGCAPPKQNQAGWINIEDISMEWDLPEGDPLIFMLNKRKKWLKSQEDPPEALSNKTDICMLVDNGFRKVRDEYHWSIQDGHIHVAPDGDTWKIKSAKKPSSPASSTWRCDIQYPRTEGTP